MKNIFKLVDHNIVSSYTGRSLTWIISIFVFALTISALIGGGGDLPRLETRIGFTAGWIPEDATGKFEGLRVLFEAECGHPVTFIWCEDARPANADLFILAAHDFFSMEGEGELVPVYSIMRTGWVGDRAVVIAKGGADQPDWSVVDPRDMAFSGPLSVNGFWIQLGLLEQRGFSSPDHVAGFRFAGDNAAIIFSVLHGKYRFGACRESDLTYFKKKGIIGDGDLKIVAASGILPELIIAAPAKNAEIYDGIIRGVRKRFLEGGESDKMKWIVENLAYQGIHGLQPVDSRQIEQLRILYGRIQEFSQ